MAIALEAGYMNGVSEDRVAPNDYLTREQAMSILSRISDAKTNRTAYKYANDSSNVSDWAIEGVSTAINEGFVAGSNGNINPQGTLTRAEALVMSNRKKNNIRTFALAGTYNLHNQHINKINILDNNITIKNAKVNNLEIKNKEDHDVGLKNIVCKNNLNVNSTAELDINLDNTFVKHTLKLNNTDTLVSIFAKGKSQINHTTLKGHTNIDNQTNNQKAFNNINAKSDTYFALNLKGNFNKLENNTTDLLLTLNGDLKKLNLNRDTFLNGESKIEKYKKSSAVNVVLDSDDIEFNKKSHHTQVTYNYDDEDDDEEDDKDDYKQRKKNKKRSKPHSTVALKTKEEDKNKEKAENNPKQDNSTTLTEKDKDNKDKVKPDSTDDSNDDGTDDSNDDSTDDSNENADDEDELTLAKAKTLGFTYNDEKVLKETVRIINEMQEKVNELDREFSFKIINTSQAFGNQVKENVKQYFFSKGSHRIASAYNTKYVYTHNDKTYKLTFTVKLFNNGIYYKSYFVYEHMDKIKDEVQKEDYKKHSAKINEILFGSENTTNQGIIKDDMTDYQKEKAIYDYLVKNYQYDHRYTTAPNQAIHDINNFLDTGTGVCESYAETFYIMAKRAGLDVKLIYGTSKGGGHVWNLVKLDDDKWYHVDVTWEYAINAESFKTIESRSEKKKAFAKANKALIPYVYFNLNDDEIEAEDHKWTKAYYPEANGETYDFYNKENLYKDSELTAGVAGTLAELESVIGNIDDVNKIHILKINCNYTTAWLKEKLSARGKSLKSSVFSIVTIGNQVIIKFK